MELLQLKYFVKIAQVGSVTGAARELHVSQPSLSQTMRRLENELGVRLFEKSGRRIKLTAEGQKFYSHIFAALQEIENASSETQNKSVKGHIVLGSYMTLKPILPALNKFVDMNPDVTFTFLRISDMSFVDQKKIDALLCYDQSDQLNFRERLYITSETRVIVTPVRGSEKGERKQEEFVSLVYDNDRIEEIFDEFVHHKEVPYVRYRTNSALFKQELMENGFATGFTNAMIASQLHQTGRYMLSKHPAQTSQIKIYLAWRASARSQAIDEFKSFMTSWFSGV